MGEEYLKAFREELETLYDEGAFSDTADVFADALIKAIDEDRLTITPAKE